MTNETTTTAAIATTTTNKPTRSLKVSSALRAGIVLNDNVKVWFDRKS